MATDSWPCSLARQRPTVHFYRPLPPYHTIPAQTSTTPFTRQSRGRIRGRVWFIHFREPSSATASLRHRRRTCQMLLRRRRTCQMLLRRGLRKTQSKKQCNCNTPNTEHLTNTNQCPGFNGLGRHKPPPFARNILDVHTLEEVLHWFGQAGRHCFWSIYEHRLCTFTSVIMAHGSHGDQLCRVHEAATHSAVAHLLLSLPQKNDLKKRFAPLYYPRSPAYEFPLCSLISIS